MTLCTCEHQRLPHDNIPNVCPEPHVHESLDIYGYCECGVRVLTSFKGFPLPDRPSHWTADPQPEEGTYGGE